MHKIYNKRYPIVAFLVWNLVFQSIAMPLLSINDIKPTSILYGYSGLPFFNNSFPIDGVQDISDTLGSQTQEEKSTVTISNNYQNKLDHGGPSTPEVQGFSATSTDEMVNLSTGDFSYTIPLLDVGGYPVSMQYNSQVSSQEDASWVGLGWSLNTGSVNRSVRGLPDDFNGDAIVREANMKKKEGYSIGTGFSVGYSGFDGALGASLGLGLDFDYDNYDGWGVKTSGNVGASASAKMGSNSMGGSLGLGLGVSSKSGGYISPSLGVSGSFERKQSETTLGLNAGFTVDSREGLKSGYFGASAKTKLLRKGPKSNIPAKRDISGGNMIFPLSFASPTFSPPFELPNTNYFTSARFQLGGTIYGVTLNGSVSGSLFTQQITQRTSKKAFGYLYSQNAKPEDLLDFNRENEGVYYNELPNLPLTAATYDIYQVNAFSGSGLYRPYRMDFGTMHDPFQKNPSYSHTSGGDIDAGNIIHVGLDIKTDIGASEKRKWKDGNPTEEIFRFKDTTASINYEPVFFKNPAELTVLNDTAVFNALGKEKAVAVKLHQEDALSTAVAQNVLVDAKGRKVSDLNAINITKKERVIRNTLFSFRTYHDIARSNEIERNPSFRIDNSAGYNIPPSPPIMDDDSKLMKEITIIDGTGLKSIFGLPALNNVIKESSFDIQDPSPTAINAMPAESSTGLVAYESNETTNDASINNKKGQANYYAATTTPAHAYAWLLTSMVSDDYQDILMDGPTPDDLGSYTKFEYKKVHQNYQWRTPVDSATFQDLLIHTPNDNKASFVYGSKEIFYLEFIKTKNFIAQFYTSPRNDGLGVRNEGGGVDDRQKVMKLDSIKLYSVHELGPSGTNKPIKTVYFEYDYSLCKNQPNSIIEGERRVGKLTLKKLYFTYQNSKKHKLSPYKFVYSDVNPDYHPKTIDRWANYKPNNPNLPNDVFPYVDQNKRFQDSISEAWLLKEIKLPIGGSLKITYESDDYAYVQDKRAQVMMPIKAVYSIPTGPYPSQKNNLGQGEDGRIIMLALPVGFPKNSVSLFEYLKDLKQIYFNVKLNVTATKYEEFTGFVPADYQLSDFGVRFGLGSGAHANDFWIKLKGVDIASNSEFVNVPTFSFSDSLTLGRFRHAFRQAAFQTIITTIPTLIDTQELRTISEISTSDFSGILDAFNTLGERFDEVFAGGPLNYLENNGRCTLIDLSNSYIRLNEPYRRKLGGGVRVKSIESTDEWKKMQSNPTNKEVDFSYGLEYVYQNEDGTSSGVATYEPMTGKDENPFFMPIPILIVKKLAADITNYQFEPLGEMFFPAPNVVYGRVTQRNKPHTGVTKHGMGYTVHKFYTAKDFPTITSRTNKYAVPKTLTVPLQVYNLSENTVVASQGFSIEINDMAGKQKSVHEYDEYNNLITSTEYFYKTDDLGKLTSEVTTINPENGLPISRQIGINYDIFVDANSYYTYMNGGGLELNVNVSLAGTVPLVIVTPIPVVNQMQSEYRGITLTKLITRNGIIDRIVTNKLGAINTQKIIAYDPNTGNPIIQEFDNEFNKKYYAVSIPAYWSYKEMGHASKNNKVIIRNIPVNGNTINFSNTDGVFTPGDMVYFRSSPSLLPTAAWVFKIVGNTIFFIQRNGDPLNLRGNYSIQIERSGYKNKISESIYEYSTVNNPLLSTSNLLAPNDILQVQAHKFSDYWTTNYGFKSEIEQGTCNCNIPKGISDRIRNVSISNRDLNSITILLTDQCSMTISTQDGRPFGNTGSFNFVIDPARNTVPECQERNYLYLLGPTPGNNQKSLPQSPTRSFIMTSDCPLVDCTIRNGRSRNAICADLLTINPFINGILGNYRKVASYVPHVKVVESTRVENAGFLLGVSPFWEYQGGKVSSRSSISNWQRTDTLIAVNNLGKHVETWNALDLPTASIYDYADALTSGVAGNAYYNDILYDGFESTNYPHSLYHPLGSNCNFIKHGKFDLSNGSPDILLNAYLDKTKSHSGLYSLKLDNSIEAGIVRPNNARAMGVRIAKETRLSRNTFLTVKEDLFVGFSPVSEKEYIFSVWVHMNEDVSNYVGPKVIINGTEYSPAGSIIDGWQQIKGQFRTSGATFNVSLKTTSTAWFDDFRIQPFDSGMETFTYSASDFKFLGKHDDQNFTTYFEYDAEGKLERTKRETEVGIYTISESRTELPKSKD